MATGFRYRVTALSTEELTVEAVIPPGCGELTLDGTGAFVRGAEVSVGGEFAPLAVEAPGAEARWHLRACPAEGCRLRYRFALGEAARRLDTLATARSAGGAVVTAPSAWLLHPSEPVGGQSFDLEVRTGNGVGFVAGFAPSKGEQAVPPIHYSGDLTDLSRSPYAAFGEVRIRRVEVGGEVLDVGLLPGSFVAGDEAMAGAVKTAAQAVHDYYGAASIPRVLLLLVPTSGRGVGYARTMGNGGASVFAPVGRETTGEELGRGWELVHELLHVSFPNLPNEQSWLEEGMATYVEPLVRARAKMITPEEAFGRLHRRMALGQPLEGDEGLDRTHTWARTYWGGALFCLAADVAIRERTDNRRSLDDALRGILTAGGNVSERWDVEQTLATGDAATGVPVLADLYERLGKAPGRVDLAALWQKLGVVGEGDRIRFDDAAPLAAVRRSMTRPP